MRIGVNCFLLQADIGGMKQYFFTLFHQLLTAHPENEYTFFHYPHNSHELAKLGTDDWKRDAVLLQDQGEVAQHLDKIDLYFCPFGALWPRPIPKAAVVMLPDIQETRYPEFFTPDDLFQRDWHFRGSTRISDLIITISAFSKETLVEHHRISPDKVRVIYPAADERYYRARQIAVRPDCRLPSAFALYPANRWKHKNHDGLLRALGLLKRQHGLSIPVVFTGHDVPNGYSVADNATRLGIADLVHQVGFLSVEEMAYLYRQARLLVFPSLYEGFGIPIVEAMAAECPIACANQTSLPEIAMNAAVYFDPTSVRSMADTIQRVWCDDNLRQQLTERGGRRARDFSARGMAREHLAAFENAVSNYSPSQNWRKHIYERYRRRLVHVKRALRFYSGGSTRCVGGVKVS